MNRLRPIAALVKNERGVLARVAGLFARRGFNIKSLAVGETEDPRISRMTIVVEGDDATVDQAVKQLGRLVCVLTVGDLGGQPRVERGLLVVKVACPPERRRELLELATIFRARVDHVDEGHLILEMTGNQEKSEAFLEMLGPYGIVELARTGQIVLGRRVSLETAIPAAPSADQEPDEPAIYNLNQVNQEGSYT